MVFFWGACVVWINRFIATYVHYLLMLILHFNIVQNVTRFWMCGRQLLGLLKGLGGSSQPCLSLCRARQHIAMYAYSSYSCCAFTSLTLAWSGFLLGIALNSTPTRPCMPCPDHASACKTCTRLVEWQMGMSHSTGTLHRTHQMAKTNRGGCHTFSAAALTPLMSKCVAAFLDCQFSSLKDWADQGRSKGRSATAMHAGSRKSRLAHP